MEHMQKRCRVHWMRFFPREITPRKMPAMTKVKKNNKKTAHFKNEPLYKKKKKRSGNGLSHFWR